MKTILILATIILSFNLIAADKTADELIDEDVNNKVISFDLGFLYKIYARFELNKLPIKYRAQVDDKQTHSLMKNISNVLQATNAQIQKELIGYIIPPIYEGSKFNFQTQPIQSFNKDNSPKPDPLPNVEWESVENADVKVWYQKSEAATQAQAARDIVDFFPEIRTKLDQVVGKTYISDAGKHQFIDAEGKKRIWEDGGNGKLDIYFVSVSGYLALTVPYPPGCSERPAWIALRPTMIGNYYAKASIAHEYMHVLQFAFPHGRTNCKEYDDPDEGIANWAINYVYPRNDFEHSYSDLIRFSGESLTQQDYESWPFFLFLEKNFGSKIIPDILNSYDLLSSWEAVDHSIPGGFEKQWPLFQIPRWNQIDQLDNFKKWDNWDMRPQYADNWDPLDIIEVKPDAKGNFYYKKEMNVKGLGNHYFDFKFTDPNIKSITFEAITSYELTQKLKLNAMVKRKAKAWAIEDWSEKIESTEACQDIHDQNIEEIIFSFSNVDFPKNGANWKFESSIPLINWEFNVQATNIGCNHLKGEFESILDFKRPDGGYDYIETTAKATFGPEGYNSDDHFIGRFWVLDGGGSFNYRGAVMNNGELCTGTLAGQFALAVRKGGGSIGMYPHQAKPGNNRRYTGAIGSIQPSTFPITYFCPGNKPPVKGSVSPVVWATGMYNVAQPNGEMNGSYTTKASDGSILYKWKIRPE